MFASDWQTFGSSILHSMRDIFNNREVAIPSQPVSNSISVVKQIEKKISNVTEYPKKLSSKGQKNEKIHFRIPERESLREI